MTIQLVAKLRELTGKQVYKLRNQGKIPAVLYGGHGAENKNLELDLRDFDKVFAEAGTNTIVDLVIDGGETIKVLVADLQQDPVSEAVIHVDLKFIRMDEKITAHVVIELIGESQAVKEEDGVLVHNLNEIEIRCLPTDLIHNIEADIVSLKTFNDTITIKDLNLSDKIEIIGHGLGDVVATVTPPKVEEEPEPVVVAEEGEEGASEEGEEEDGQDAKAGDDSGAPSAEKSDTKDGQSTDNKKAKE